jgi:hypothetical protein
VRLDYRQDELRVEVTDDGHGLTDSAAEAAYAAYLIGQGMPGNAPFAVNYDHDPSGSPGAAGGHGLRGMRERAKAAGGSIEIGPLPTGGFRIAAALPLTGTPAATVPAGQPASAGSGAAAEAAEAEGRR